MAGSETLGMSASRLGDHPLIPEAAGTTAYPLAQPAAATKLCRHSTVGVRRGAAAACALETRATKVLGPVAANDWPQPRLLVTRAELVAFGLPPVVAGQGPYLWEHELRASIDLSTEESLATRKSSGAFL